MKKLLILLGCVLLSSAGAFAQGKGSIAATLRDAKTNEGINGAVIELTNTKDGSQLYYTSGYKGIIDIKRLAPATYKMAISFLGYKTHTEEVKVADKEINLGIIKLKEDATIMDNIEVTGYMRTSQKGDTISYNASAFKTARDASTEGLLSKMPGITINSDGTVNAQGEEVGKVLVDGKEFFGEDVATTIKTIPAEMVSKIEVFDKLSDKAEFTGLDDGEGYKAINIVTNIGKKRSVFGKVYGSYGYPDKYNVGGNANIFGGDEKISIIAMANNINQLNFSFEDIVGATGGGGGGHGGGRSARRFMVQPISGISTVQSAGLNYANVWDKLELQGSYFINHSTTHNLNTTDKTSIGSNDYSEDSKSQSESNSENWNHRLNMRLDYKINDAQSIMVRAMGSVQQYDNLTEGSELISNGITGEALKDMTSVNAPESTGLYGNIFALYRARLGKPGRTITLNTRANWNTSNHIQETTYTYTLPTDSLYNSIIDRATGSNSIRGEVTYTEPLSEKAQIDIEYEMRHNLNNQDKGTQVFINGIEDTTLGTLLSNISESGYTTQRIGPAINFSSEKTKFNFRVNYQYSTLENVQSLPQMEPVNYDFNDFTYQGNLTVNFNKTNTLRVRTHSRTNNPSISQLQEAVDVSGSSFTAGNPNLKPSYSHQLNTFYTNTNVEKGRTLMLYAGMWASTRSIVSSMQMNRPDYIIEGLDNQLLGVGNTYSTYENISGLNNWSLWSGASYGFPLKALKSNFTLNVGVNLSNTPSKINDHLNIMKGQTYSGGVQVGSNISENLDFTLAYNFDYTINDNTSKLTSMQNHYFRHFARAEFKWVAWKGFTLTANGTYNQYKGITDSYNEEILLCNAYIGKKLFEDQMGEISIGVNDIFNQNRDFRRSTGANYIQNVTNLALGRYVAVQFVYNIRSMGAGQSGNFDNMGMGGGGGRRGGPH